MPATFGIWLLQSRRTSGVQASRWAAVGSARLAVAMARAKAGKQRQAIGKRMKGVPLKRRPRLGKPVRGVKRQGPREGLTGS